MPCGNPQFSNLTNHTLPRHHLLHLTHETLTLISATMTTLHGSRRNHLCQPPWKLVFRPPSRLTVTAPPSSSIRAATAAPPFSPPPRICALRHHLPHCHASAPAATRIHHQPQQRTGTTTAPPSSRLRTCSDAQSSSITAPPFSLHHLLRSRRKQPLQRSSNQRISIELRTPQLQQPLSSLHGPWRTCNHHAGKR